MTSRHNHHSGHHESDERPHKKCRRKRDKSEERDNDNRSKKNYDNRRHDYNDKKHEYNESRNENVRKHDSNGRRYDYNERNDARKRNNEYKSRRDNSNENDPPKHKRSFQEHPAKSKWENDVNDRRGDRKEEKWGKNDDDQKDKKPIENKAKPDFGLSGKLAEEVNTYKGVVIKYAEPSEARKPKRRWRLYPFKGEEVLPTLYIHRQSAYLIGRERHIVDLPVDHPSCSKQHAVLQYRVVPYRRDNGSKGNRVRPYIIDLESANGTYVNNQKIEARKYVELLEKDVLKFGYSSREYVVLHEHSKDDEDDDNVYILEDKED